MLLRHSLVFMMDTIATASVDAIIAPNIQAWIHSQPYLRRSRMYSMMGTIATQVAPTTRNASVNTCTMLWRQYKQYNKQAAQATSQAQAVLD